jgi:hypothetical protein
VKFTEIESFQTLANWRRLRLIIFGIQEPGLNESYNDYKYKNTAINQPHLLKTKQISREGSPYKSADDYSLSSNISLRSDED